jgi:hypothetical protein
MTHRKYVVDEVMGVVDVFMGFTGLDRTRNTEGAPDSHMFRVEGGRIRYIHTASACFVDGCGMNGTGMFFCICETVVEWCADMLVDPGIGGRFVASLADEV